MDLLVSFFLLSEHIPSETSPYTAAELANINFLTLCLIEISIKFFEEIKFINL